MKTHLIFGRGRLTFTYRSQTNPQPICADILDDGTVHVFGNPEIGNAVPMDVYHGIIQRVGVWGVSTQAEAREWYRSNKTLIQRIVAGMDKRWDGNNFVGTLTDDARRALDTLDCPE